MPKVEVTLSDRTESELQRMVDQGEFLNRDQAVEELLTMGLSAYDTDVDSSDDRPDEELFTQVVEEQQDPAQLDDAQGDDYTF
jgi:Arc/MetJ-type ribon-helix-helix transcriptional regulator